MRREQIIAVTAATTKRPGVGTCGIARWLGATLVGTLLCAPLAARAVEADLGVSVGGMLAGTVPRLAISPHGGVAVRVGDHFRVGARDMLSILPAFDAHGAGFYNQLSPTIEFTWQDGNVSLGPSLGIFSMPACGNIRCTRLNGVAPGGTAEASVYFAGPFGVSARVNVDWINGLGSVLPGSVAVVIVAGPVFRLSGSER